MQTLRHEPRAWHTMNSKKEGKKEKICYICNVIAAFMQQQHSCQPSAYFCVFKCALSACVLSMSQPYKDKKTIHWAIHCQTKIEQSKNRHPKSTFLATSEIRDSSPFPPWWSSQPPRSPPATPSQQFLSLL